MHTALHYLHDASLQYMLLGVVLANSTTALVGSFSLLQKKGLVGDAIAHALLPGLCLGFMCTGTKDPLYLLGGGLLSGTLAVWSIEGIGAYSKLKKDTAIAVVLSVFFGIGVLLLGIIQHMGTEAQAGLQSFLLGQASALVARDIVVFSLLALVILAVVILFFKELRLLTFDPQYAQAIGLPVRSLEAMLQLLTILAIFIGIKSVGIVLISAMLIAPAAAARYWTDQLGVIALLAILFAALASAVGTYCSLLAPALPTGPCIIIVLTFIALLSFLLAPKKGFLRRKYAAHQYRQKMLLENVLKIFHELGQKEGDPWASRPLAALQQHRTLGVDPMQKALRKLVAAGLLSQPTATTWALTQAGKEKGAHIAHLHGLWEAYLLHYLHLPADHVHEDAESIEHLITPELEKALQQLLRTHQPTPSESELPKGSPI